MGACSWASQGLLRAWRSWTSWAGLRLATHYRGLAVMLWARVHLDPQYAQVRAVLKLSEAVPSSWAAHVQSMLQHLGLLPPLGDGCVPSFDDGGLLTSERCCLEPCDFTT